MKHNFILTKTDRLSQITISQVVVITRDLYKRRPHWILRDSRNGLRINLLLSSILQTNCLYNKSK